MLGGPAAAGTPGATPVERGAYLVRAGGCIACHTDEKNGGAPFAGGRALKTPFGTYYSPNITPDPDTGIGKWSDADFLKALQQGKRPDGSHLFPVFPYPYYTRMHRDDVLAIKAYLFSLKPVVKPNREHDSIPPFGWRWTVGNWKALFFQPGEFKPDPARSDEWNRGAYLVQALGHCGACHTPRNALGGPKTDLYLAGTTDGPDGDLVPNITPDPKTGIADWSKADIVSLLRDGMKPDFDDVQGSMAEAVRDGTSHLTDADLEAIASYLKSVPPIEHRVAKGAK